MKKNAIRFVKIFGVILICFVTFLFAFSLTLQSSWGKEKIHQWIQKIATQNHAKIEIKNISGALPFSWTIDQCNITIEDKFDLKCENVSFRLSIFALIKQELSFRSLQIQKCRFQSLESQKPKESAQEFVDYTKELAIGIRVKPLKIHELYLQDHPNPQQIKGKFFLAKAGKYISFKWIVHSSKNQEERLIITTRGSPSKGILGSAQFENYLPAKSIDFPLNGKIQAYTSWKGLINLFTPCPTKELIKGKFFFKLPLSFLSNLGLPQNMETVEAKGQFVYQHQQSFQIPSMKIENKWFHAKSNFSLGPDLHVQSGKTTLWLHSFSQIFPEAKGSGKLQLEISQEDSDYLTYQLNLQIPQLTYQNFQMSDYQIQSDGIYKNETLTGQVEGQFIVNDLDHRIAGKVNYTKENGFQVPLLTIDSSNSIFESELSMTPYFTLIGNTHFFIKDFHSWFVLYPDFDIYGTIEGDVHWEDQSGTQNLNILALIENFRYQTFWSRYIDLSAIITDVSLNPKGSISALFQDANFWGIDLTSFYVFTSNETENWPFTLRSEGVWKSPFSFTSQGFWRSFDCETLLNIQEFSGFFFEHSFDMPEPFQILAKNGTLDTQPLLITLENSELHFQANISEDQSNIDLTMDHFPLDFLSFNPLDIDIGGYASTRFHLEEKKKVEAELDLSLEEFNLWAMDEQLPFTFTGQVHAKLKNEMCRLFSHLQSNDVDMMQLNGDIPMQLHIAPYQFKLKQKDSMNVNMHFDGPLEQILDFINIGPQRLEGDFICDIHLSQTLQNPKLQGVCQLRNGFYENYFTGMILENLFARFVADENQLILQSLTASDPVEGKISATGVMQLNPKQHFPFIVHSKLTDLEVIRLDSLTTYTRGDLELKGNTKNAKLKGNVRITDAYFSIPGKIHRDLPSLEVTYIPEKKESLTQMPMLTKTSYPIDLNLKLSAPSTITVSGRGVHSKWKGDVELGGEYPEEILAKGRLDMVRGEFVFSGKVFDLSEGELVFNEKKAPFLNLSGSLTEQGILIIANLKGDLTKPKLTFQSSPPLPLSAILSYLRFGKDISEISGLEAIQLASAVAAISGEGPDYLEETRRSLGVDRLAIINQPTGDGQSISVQVGKYITKNVLVSVSQGAQQNSTNVTVEVDLKKGLIFQAETQQQQVQGKFTLKWNQNF